MRRWLIILSVFLLGIGASQLFTFFRSQKQPLPPVEPIETTKEARLLASERSDGGQATSSAKESSVVTRVIDGDTVELSDGRKLRYIGIDTPEIVAPGKPVECFGREAKLENEKLVNNKAVRLEKDISETDKYKRILRYVYVGDIFVNDYLIRQGFAHASTYPPDVKFSQQFLEAEREARENNRGLWSGCTSSTIQQFNNSTVSPSNVEGAQTGCTIKGNISTSGEKIYHLPGCGSYNKTSIDQAKGERWFCTESEAVAAGWRKAKNC